MEYFFIIRSIASFSRSSSSSKFSSLMSYIGFLPSSFFNFSFSISSSPSPKIKLSLAMSLSSVFDPIPSSSFLLSSTSFSFLFFLSETSFCFSSSSFFYSSCSTLDRAILSIYNIAFWFLIAATLYRVVPWNSIIVIESLTPLSLLPVKIGLPVSYHKASLLSS